MKKPKFTPGPWAVNPSVAQVDAFDADFDGIPGPRPICGMLWPTDERSEPETFNNAQVISAVPEMIDALIQSYLLIDDMPIDERNERHLRAYNKIADALEKAGVKLNQNGDRDGLRQ